MIRKRMERSHTIMAKWMKKLLGLAAIGSAAAGLVYYFKKSKKDVDEDFNDDFEDEDFDLDNDLQPVDRGYVDLNAGKASRKKQTMQKKQRPAKILWMRMLTKGKKISSADTD